jgi:hypothetical protein
MNGNSIGIVISFIIKFDYILIPSKKLKIVNSQNKARNMDIQHSRGSSIRN